MHQELGIASGAVITNTNFSRHYCDQYQIYHFNVIAMHHCHCQCQCHCYHHYHCHCYCHYQYDYSAMLLAD